MVVLEKILLGALTKQIIILIGLIAATTSFAQEKTIQFSNLTWVVRDGFGNPRENYWSPKNVWVDNEGRLHLKIIFYQGKWYCGGIYSDQKLGFGEYHFSVIGKLYQNPNTTLAIFNYPTAEIGPDMTNEIDMEFFQQGSSNTDVNASYAVWPTTENLGRAQLLFKINQNEMHTIHSFKWTPDEVSFQSSQASQNIMTWRYTPPLSNLQIPQHPLPLYIYFYLQNPIKAINQKSYEIIIEKFCYTSLVDKTGNCVN